MDYSVQPNSKRQINLLLISVALATFLSKLDRNVVNISLPAISSDLQITYSTASWLILAFLLASTSTLLLFGRLGDQFGLKRIFLIGYFVFMLSSVLCGIPLNIDVLIAARFFQGIGCAMLQASTLALISKYFAPSVVGKYFGLMTTIGAAGIFLGAPVGGFITTYAGWHWIFLINIPFCILAIISAQIFIPKDSIDKNKKVIIDYPGCILSFIFVSALIIALNMGEEKGWTSLFILSIVSVAILTMIIFIYWEKHHKEPMIKLSLFKNSNFSLAMIATFIGFLPIAGSNFLAPFFLQNNLGLSADKAGLVTLIYSGVLIVASPFAGKLSDKMNPQILCFAGMVLGALSFIYVAFSLSSMSVWVIVIFFFFVALSYSIFASPNNNLIMKMSSEENKGVVSGTLNTAVNMAATLGILLFETIYSLFTINKLSHVGPGLKQTVGNSDSIHGYVVAFYIGAGICAITAILSIISKLNKVK